MRQGNIFYILKLKTETMLMLYSAQSYSLWYQINVVPSHNLPREKEPEGLGVYVTKADIFQTQTDTDEQKPHKICFEVDHISIFWIICSECFITALIRMKIIIYQVQIYIRGVKKIDWEHWLPSPL
jgi:hypothetical protein